MNSTFSTTVLDLESTLSRLFDPISTEDHTLDESDFEELSEEFRENTLSKARKLIALSRSKEQDFLRDLAAIYGRWPNALRVALSSGTTSEAVLRSLGRTITGVSRMIEDRRPIESAAEQTLVIKFKDWVANWNTDPSTGIDLRKAAMHSAQYEGEFPPECCEAIAKQILDGLENGSIVLPGFQVTSKAVDSLVLTWSLPDVTQELHKLTNVVSEEEVAAEYLSEAEELRLSEHAPFLAKLYERAAVESKLSNVKQKFRVFDKGVPSGFPASAERLPDLVQALAKEIGVPKERLRDCIELIAINAAKHANENRDQVLRILRQPERPHAAKT